MHNNSVLQRITTYRELTLINNIYVKQNEVYRMVKRDKNKKLKNTVGHSQLVFGIVVDSDELVKRPGEQFVDPSNRFNRLINPRYFFICTQKINLEYRLRFDAKNDGFILSTTIELSLQNPRRQLSWRTYCNVFGIGQIELINRLDQILESRV